MRKQMQQMLVTMVKEIIVFLMMSNLLMRYRRTGNRMQALEMSLSHLHPAIVRLVFE